MNYIFILKMKPNLIGFNRLDCVGNHISNLVRVIVKPVANQVIILILNP